MLERALVDEPPHLRRDGGFVRAGFRADLDEARGLRDDSRKVMAALEARYVEETGIKSLKVRHNNILGFYVEVPADAAKPLLSEPLAQTFRHRQTMAGAVRFTTEELVEIESRIVSAAERALAIEQEVFAELAAAIAAQEQALGELAGALAELDCEAGLAELAAEQGYTRPVLDDSSAFEIRGGRHPVVEQALKAARAGAFIENDCVLVTPRPDRPAGFDEMAEARVWLVTGPNMAGKSTFLRQNALIAVLAQMGSFVPARSAHIGVVDRLFSRVGAADDLARGRSTFMVEMVETAGILNQATDALARHPRRDRPRHRHLRRPLDRLGGGGVPARGQPLPRAVCHALSRADRAGRAPARGRQRHHGRARVEGRDRLPAQGQAGRRRPQLRHPGGQARRPARSRVTKRAAEVLELLEKADRKAADGEALLGRSAAVCRPAAGRRGARP